MTALVGLSLPHLPITAAGADTVPSRLGALVPWLPRDALTLALLTVCAALLVLALTLRQALPSAPHAKVLVSALPSHTDALAWARRTLIRIVELLEDDEDDGGPAPALAHTPPPPEKAPRTFTIGGTQYRLPAAPAPPRAAAARPTQRPTQRGAPLSSPPAPQFSFDAVPPPQLALPRRPLSAAKMIMSRHSIRKPYRSPPVPGAPRSTPCSRLASTSETVSEAS